MKLLATLAVSAALVVPVAADSATTLIPSKWKNCTFVNKRYPHGVGKATARDRTTDAPVTNFKRSTRLYNEAMSYNKRLDRDKDGIACES